MSEPREPSRFVIATPGETFQITQPPDNLSIRGGNGNPLVTIRPTGELEYGPGYEPNEAARRFWDALRHHMPARCPNCGHVGLASNSKENSA